MARWEPAPLFISRKHDKLFTGPASVLKLLDDRKWSVAVKLTGHTYLVGAFVAFATFFNSFSASAETDMSKIKCGEFTQIMQSKDPQMEVAGALFIGFLWGLYKEDDEPLVIGNASDNEKLGKLAAFCATNPNTNLMTAADRSMN